MGDALWIAVLGPVVGLLGLVALIELAVGWLRVAPRAAAGESLD